MRLQTAYDIYRRYRRAVATPADLREVAEQWRTENARKGGGEQYETPLVENDRAIPAYVNHGRWLVDCDCGNGAPIAPWAEAVCFSCGTVWTHVVYAEDPNAVSTVLAQRPHARTQHWRPGETLDQLRAENEAHGIRGTR